MLISRVAVPPTSATALQYAAPPPPGKLHANAIPPLPVLVLEAKADGDLSHAVHHGVLSPAQISLARRLLFLAVMSGLCVMSLFLILVLGVAGIAICMSIHAIAVITAAIVGSNVAREGFSWRLRTGLDTAAGMGVALLAITSVFYFGLRSFSRAATCVLIGLLLSPAASTSRHVKLYRELSD